MIFGVDSNPNAIEVAKENLQSFTFDDFQNISVSSKRFQDFDPPTPPSLLITNPPYGNRLDAPKEELISTYRDIGHFLKKKCSKPSKAFILTGSISLSHEIGLKSSRRHIFFHGGVETRLLEYDIY